MLRLLVVRVLIAACLRGVCASTCAEGGQVEALWGSGSGYDRFTRPNWARRGTAPAEPDVVSLQLQFFSLRTVDTRDQTFEVEVYIRTLWTDPRLRHNGTGGCFTGFAGTPVGKVWVPDLVLVNKLNEEKLFSAFWVYGDGLVWWTRKSIIKLACSMSFTQLPYDTQHCGLVLGGWRDGSPDVAPRFMDPPFRQTPGQGGSVEWSLAGMTAGTMDPPRLGYLGGEAVGVQWTFTLARSSDYYVRYVLQPGCLMVTIAWVSFFVSRYAVPARASMTIICFLVIAGLARGVEASLPRVTGTVWLLSYLGLSEFFVFYSILEFAAANVLTRLEERITKATEQDSAAAAACAAGKLGPLLVHNGRLIIKGQHLDIFSRYVFPMAYAFGVGVLFATL